MSFYRFSPVSRSPSQHSEAGPLASPKPEPPCNTCRRMREAISAKFAVVLTSR